MCGHIGQLELEFDPNAIQHNMERMQRFGRIMEKVKKLSPGSYHIPLWKQAVIIPQKNPDQPLMATFAWMEQTRQSRPWPVFNVRVEGGWNNKSNDPNYHGPFAIFTNPYVRDQIMTQRCVIPVDFFLEQPDKKLYPKDKRKFLIRRENKTALYLAGIYNEIIDEETGEVTYAFTIKTTARSKITEHTLHMRSPLVIPEDTIFDYLDPTATQEQLSAFYYPPASDGYIAYEVMPELAKRKLPEGYSEDDARLIEPIGEILKVA